MLDIKKHLQQSSDEVIKRHHLEGLSFSLFKKSQYKPQWKKQWVKNTITLSLLKDLGRLIKDNSIEVTLLKGFSLLGDIYSDWGGRFASDVDLLVSSKEEAKLKLCLISLGFVEQQEQKWRGNDFKSTFIKYTSHGEIVVEVHTRLFWHALERKRAKRTCVAIEGFKILNPEEQLLHLCGHLAFQHNFLKLFWLADIQLFLNHYQTQLNWQKFWRLAKMDSLMVSSFVCVSMTFIGQGIKQQSFKLSLADRFKVRILLFLVTPSFVDDPRSFPLRYFLVKALLKDHFYENFQYLLGWLRVTIFSKPTKVQGI